MRSAKPSRILLRICAIWRQNADGRAAAEPLTDPTEGVHLDPVLAPDGRLAYAVTEPTRGDFDLMIVALPDGTPERLVGGDGYQAEAAFSPDGRLFAYNSSNEIYVEPYPRDGSTPRLVSAGNGNAARPVWSADGMRLAFQSGDRQVTIVTLDAVTLAVRGRATFEVPLAPRLRNFDRMQRISAVPNSDSWLVLVEAQAGNAQTAADEIVIVENWIRELEARVPPLSSD